MTLNLTLVSPNLIVQTSDFRLTAGREIRSHTAQKQTVLQYRDWSGLVCYTGIAKWGDHDTAAWLDQVLPHPAGQRTPQDIADTLARKGRAWLRQIPEEHRVHAFTLTTFEQGRPTVYLVSNVMRPDGSWKSERPAAFCCYRLQPEQPWCLVTGYAPAVDSRQTASLEALMNAGTSPARLRRVAAEASRAAASRAENTVSEECVASHLSPDRAGESEVFGNLPARFMPNGTIDGRLIAPQLVVDEGDGPQRLVGAEWHVDSGGAVRVMNGAYRRLDQQQGTGWREMDG
ncbi:hypothetical protein C7C46_32310 [Streptomyces tateyamensis]|uniref:Uncharacterized protein n=1 Tax=Streptomyces tateyamensis TaxID=565073 RepID=A0A2V4N4L8_9ACTN|nr:hypothetical protein [Streptomyces tateyamensis]PYC65735.1 hypothetical protein C7C46_32310 [Streptomyces tateyamensis]